MRGLNRIIFVLSLFFLAVVFVLLPDAPAYAKKDKPKPRSLSKAVIRLRKKKLTYNGKAKTPLAGVWLKGKRLVFNKDYKVVYKKNIEPGKGTVIVKTADKSRFRGKKTAVFRIRKAERTIITDKAGYTAVVGDGAFTIGAEPSKGAGRVAFSSRNTKVAKVSKRGRVTVRRAGTAVIDMKVGVTPRYHGAKAAVKVKVQKQPVRPVDSEASIRECNYPVLNYACANRIVTDFSWSVDGKYTIPGMAPTLEEDLYREYIHCGNLCPQGICFAGGYLLVSAYCMDGIHASCLFVLDRDSGKYLNTVVLSEKSSVGGITYDGGSTEDGNIWVCHWDSNRLQRIPYSDLKKYATGSKTCVWYKADENAMADGDGFHLVSCKPSAVAYNACDGYLWVTERLLPSSGRDAVMTAYEYRDGTLQAVNKYIHPAEEDFLGIITDDMEEEEIAAYGVSSGAVVVNVLSEKAGLYLDGNETGALPKATFFEEGDIIVGAGGRKVGSPAELDEILRGCEPGQKIQIEAVRRADNGTVAGVAGIIEFGNRSTKTVERTIPYFVQGISFTQDGKAVFSRSQGRNQSKKLYMSELMIYEATWSRDSIWDADEVWNELMAVALPPMVEEVEVNGNELCILFESAAMTYLEGTDGKGRSDSPIDKIISIDLTGL